MNVRIRLALAAFPLLVLAASGQVPELIGYQGRLVDGTNLVNGTVNIGFTLYDAAAAGSAQYAETDAGVAVVDGLYATTIGDNPTVGDLWTALTNAELWIEVSIDGTPLSPRERVVSVAYAGRAGEAADVPGNVFWRTDGNTPGSGLFLGTLDNSALDLRVNNQRALRLVPDATSPQVVGGYSGNEVAAGVPGGTIGGGGHAGNINRITWAGSYGVIGGGSGNVLGNGSTYTAHGVIGGGQSNTVVSEGSLVAGGIRNRAESLYAAVAGGYRNTALNLGAFVGGGETNVAAGKCATVPGGYRNAASGDYSFAAGCYAKAWHDGTFVWADSLAANFESTTSNQFLIRARGGVLINTNAGSPAHTLTVSGTIYAHALTGNGSGLTMINGSNIAVGTIQGDKIQNRTIVSVDVAENTFWETGGNAGTVAGTHFVGTTDDQPLILRANNQQAVRLEGGGSEPNVIGGYVENTADVGVVGATIGGGGGAGVAYNRVSDNYGTVGGGQGNRAGNSGGGVSDRTHGTVGGGLRNINNAQYGTIAGGVDNTLTSQAIGSFVGGGSNNVANGSYNVIAGGRSNLAFGAGAVVGGGLKNTASNSYSTAAGGTDNRAIGAYAAIGGGYLNLASSNGATVAGGILNAATGWAATVAGGEYNMAGGHAAVVGGGWANTAAPSYSVVAGGYTNAAYGEGSVIGGGGVNTIGASSDFGTIAGGLLNAISNSAPAATVAGGTANVAGDDGATVGGGATNIALGLYSSIGGGLGNSISVPGNYSVIAGGQRHEIGDNNVFIGGGFGNICQSEHSVVAGGSGNRISGGGNYSVIAGGYRNIMTNDYSHGSFIGGGYENVVSGRWSVIAGGRVNNVGKDYAVVGGGATNAALGEFSVVPGGSANTASGRYAFAAGYRAKAMHAGSFVWADSQNANFSSTTTNEFAVRAEEGLRLSEDAGEDKAVPFGTWFRDNAVVAWAKVFNDGTLTDSFNVHSVTNAAVGRYDVMLKSGASAVSGLIPVANAEIDSQPSSAATIRLVTVDQTHTNRFRVYINDGTFAPVDAEFTVVVFGR